MCITSGFNSVLWRQLLIGTACFIVDGRILQIQSFHGSYQSYLVCFMMDCVHNFLHTFNSLFHICPKWNPLVYPFVQLYMETNHIVYIPYTPCYTVKDNQLQPKSLAPLPRYTLWSGLWEALEPPRQNHRRAGRTTRNLVTLTRAPTNMMIPSRRWKPWTKLFPRPLERCLSQEPLRWSKHSFLVLNLVVPNSFMKTSWRNL